MQKNNAKLGFNFSKAKAYSDKTRGVEVTVDPNTGKQVIYARLYKTYIVKLEENGMLYIRHGGWPTVTTTKAINACLVALRLTSWTYTKRQLVGPFGVRIDVGPDWTAVDCGATKYLVS